MFIYLIEMWASIYRERENFKNYLTNIINNKHAEFYETISYVQGFIIADTIPKCKWKSLCLRIDTPPGTLVNIMHALCHNNTIEKVDLRYCHITIEVSMAICDLLDVRPIKIQLWESDNDLSEESYNLLKNYPTVLGLERFSDSDPNNRPSFAIEYEN